MPPAAGYIELQTVIVCHSRGAEEGSATREVGKEAVGLGVGGSRENCVERIAVKRGLQMARNGARIGDLHHRSWRELVLNLQVVGLTIGALPVVLAAEQADVGQVRVGRAERNMDETVADRADGVIGRERCDGIRGGIAGSNIEGEVRRRAGTEAIVLIAAVEEAETCMDYGFVVDLIREAEPWSEVLRLCCSQAIVAGGNEGNVVFCQQSKECLGNTCGLR